MGSVPIKFTNQGVAQRVEPSDLTEGQYYDLSNMISSQEGTLEVRGGSFKIGNWGASLPGPIASISKLRISATDSLNPRYFQTIGGSASKMYRGFPAAYNQYGIGSYSAPPTDITGTANLYAERIGMTQFNSGDGNQPNLYIAGGNGNYRDNGSYTSLQRHGILPPTIPAQVFKGGVNVVPIAYTGAGTTTRVSDTIAGTPALVSGAVAGPSGSGQYVITPTTSASMYSIVNSMPITIGSYNTIVDAVSSTAFTCWVATPPTAGMAITAYQSDTVPTPAGANSGTTNGVGNLAGFSTVPNYITISGGAVNLGFTGLYADGYSSGDFIHIGLWIGGSMASSNFASAHLQLFSGNATANTGGDYYDAVISPSAASVIINSSQTVVDSTTSQQISQALAAYYLQYEQQAATNAMHNGDFDNTGNYGAYGNGSTMAAPNPSSAISALNPQYQYTGSNSSNPFTTGTWMEYDIPKNTFTEVGRAGTGIYLWNSVFAWNLTFTATAMTDTIQAVVSGICGEGGGGPNTAVSGSLEYSYCYTFRNPVTLSESNPSMEIIPQNRVPASLRQNLVVVSTPPYSASLDVEINEVGQNTIAIYRSGGVFADDLYRFVGYASVPSSGTTALFIDNLPDSAIASSTTVEWDNYAPVFATLPITFIGKIQSGSPSMGPGLVTLTVGSIPTGFNYAISMGSEIQVGWNSTSASTISSDLETCIVQTYTKFSTTANITLYLQNQHYAGELVECEAVAGYPCRYCAQAYNSLFYAGDTMNPHILYMSKPGRPDSFPVITEATGTANQLVVGSPSNPIMNLVEIAGKLISMNLADFYEIPVWNGTMQAPVKAGAQRGLMASCGWAKGNNSIFYVATDGVYAWQGGQSQKISGQIDWVFRDRVVNGMSPIDRTTTDDIICGYFQNNLYMAYTAVDGNSYYWVFDTVAARWYRSSRSSG